MSTSLAELPDPAAAFPESVASRAAARVRRWLHRLRPPRRLHFHRSGWIFSVGAVFLGLSAIATGNNLLFLILGAMLGFIGLSGWMSEQVLRGLVIRRRVPRGVTAGRPARLVYEVKNRKRRIPSLALGIGEVGREERAFVGAAEPRATVFASVEVSFERRGVYALSGATLGTSFPFGLFRKERDIALPGEVVVWPRTDRPVRAPRLAGERAWRAGGAAANMTGARGEFRSLRDYRAGDDPRDVHWRSSARRVLPVVREYDRDDAHAFWICLDLRAHDGDAAEAAVESAAALAAHAVRVRRPFGLATADVRLSPDSGPAHLERVLDALARAHFRTAAPPLRPPAAAAQCVLVSPFPAGAAGWGDVLNAAEPSG